jgi:hypothetical protein
MKVLQFTVLNKDEFVSTANRISHTFPSLEMDKIFDIDSEGDVTNHTVIVVGFGDNIYPFDKIAVRLNRAHNNGIPILFTHGTNPYADSGETLTDSEIDSMIDSISFSNKPSFTNLAKTASKNALLNWREAVTNLGFSGPQRGEYNYYSTVSIKTNIPALHSPYNVGNVDFQVQQTHSYGVKLSPNCVRILINPAVTDDGYNWHLAGYTPVGKGRIAYLNFGHNDFDRNNLWNDITINDAKLLVNTMVWLGA